MRMLLAAVMMLALLPFCAHADTPGEITGAWSGSYTQRVDGKEETVAFFANINERGGAFSGMTREPNRTGDNDAATFAVLSGREVAGGGVSFTKTYATGGWTHGVEYEGRFVSPDRIEGTWRIGAAGGPFAMTRN